jgi:dipeptidyl aminopeptidase/acylaminoacyl peptidase/leucyl aminopeptidase (aminopeptidase T)
MQRLLCVLCVSVVLAAQRHPMTFDDVIKLRQVGSAQIAPGGHSVVYTVNEADMKENAWNSDLWLAPAAGGPARRLTTHPKNDSAPQWSPDGRRIAFLSARTDPPQIHVIAPDGGEPEKLTDHKTAVSAFQWSPDGKSIAFLAADPLPEAKEKRQKDKDDAQVMDGEYRMTHLWVLDVAARKERRLTRGEDTLADPQWSPDGRWIAYVTRPTPHANDGGLSDIWVMAADGAGGPRRLAGGIGPEQSPRWSPDGKWLAFTGRPNDTDTVRYNRLFVVAAGDAGAQPREVTRGFQFGSSSAEWSRDGRWLYVVSQQGTEQDLFAIAADDSAARRVTGGKGVVGGFSQSKDGGTIAFTWSHSEQPADVYISAADSFRPTRLTDTNPQLKDISLGRTEVVRWKSRDGMEIEGLLLYPIGYQAGRKYPLIVNVHGGPAGAYGQSFMAGWANFGQVWAGKGWLAFYPNFRGSAAYGETFQRANVNGWGRGDFDDIQSGVDMLVAKGLADPERMAQTGWSYGGYLTAWTITQTTRFKAAMAGAGLTNMLSMYSTNDLQRVLDSYFGGPPWGRIEAYLGKSAMNFITRARTPTLILHCASDVRVPPTQGVELYIGLKQNGVPVEMVTFPREPHGLGEPRHQLDKMRREYEWIARHTLGAGPEPQRSEVKLPPINFVEVAGAIIRSLDVKSGERVMMHFDPTYYPELVEELRKQLYSKGAVHVGATLADTASFSRLRAGKESAEYKTTQGEWFKKMLADTDIFLWLPMRGDRGLPIEQLMSEARWKGRAIHFHWVGQPLIERGPEVVAWLSGVYEEALKVDPATLGATMDRLIAGLRAGKARLTAPGGTDLTFEVRDRPFHKNDGVATRERAALADRTGSLRDREFELPAGALRVIPVEDSWEGTLNYNGTKLGIKSGRITEESVRASPELWKAWSRHTGDKDRIGELVIGTNPKLVPVDNDLLPYYGYGAGIVRLHFGDNWESGGRLRSSRNEWYFLRNATLEVGGTTLIRDGRIVE